MEIFDGSTTPVNYNCVFSSIPAACNKYAGLGRSTAATVPLVHKIHLTHITERMTFVSASRCGDALNFALSLIKLKIIPEPIAKVKETTV